MTVKPAEVVTEIGPVVAKLGTEVLIFVVVAEVMGATVAPTCTTSPLGSESKFVPLMVIAVPAVPTVGVNPEMDGGLGPPAVTVNDSPLVADPFGEVTVTVPLVTPEGTVARIEFALAEFIVAVVPLKLTESLLTVELKPEPEIVT